jgi:glycosyltransferase involved in cell wall biosynthesis
MRILFFSHYFPPEGNAPASRVYDMAKRWVAAGHEVQVITCAPSVPNGMVYEGYKNRLWQTEVMDGIRVARVWTYIAANKGTIRRITNYVSYMLSAVFFSLFVKKPDIVIATSPQFFAGWAGLITSKLRRIPFLLEIRDLWPDTIIAVGAMQNQRLLRVIRRLEGWMYAGATHIVTVGEGYRQKLLEKGVESDKISIVPNGADLDFFYPRCPSEELRRRFNLQDKVVCAYVGTLGLCSGLAVVPRAAKILIERGEDSLAFLLVGDGATRNALEEMAQEHGLRNVVFAGRQDKRIIPDLLASCDICFAHLQKKDLFKIVLPSKVFEAAAMAKPIILGVEGCAAELVKNAEAGICIEPENAEDLATAFERLAKDPQLRTRMGESARRYVVQHFDRDKLAADYIALIERFAQANHCRMPHNMPVSS